MTIATKKLLSRFHASACGVEMIFRPGPREEARIIFDGWYGRGDGWEGYDALICQALEVFSGPQMTN